MKDKSEIKTVWVDSEIGEQMMFAVPMECENMPVVDKYSEIRMEALKWEVLDYLKTQIEMFEEWKYFECPPETRKHITTLKVVMGDVAKIFEKY